MQNFNLGIAKNVRYSRKSVIFESGTSENLCTVCKGQSVVQLAQLIMTTSGSVLSGHCISGINCTLYTEAFGSNGSVGDGHFVRYSRKSVTLGFFLMENFNLGIA